MFSRGAGAEAESDIATDAHADAEGEESGGVAEPKAEAAAGEDGPEAGYAAGEGAGDGAGDGYGGEAGLEDGYEAGEGYEPGDGYEATGEGYPPEDGAEESFFGMQSEGLVLTGIALGPGLRRLARVCLAVALGLGVVLWFVLALLYGHRVFFGDGHTNPDMPNLVDDRPWAGYYLVGALWAVGVGVWGLATRGGFARLTWCFGCLVTAFFWPLGMAASVAAVAIRRPGAAMSRRLLLAGLAVLVAAGGVAWRVDAPSVGPQQTAASSDTDLLGTWHSRSGIHVQLNPDGTFEAESLSGGGLRDGETVGSASGRWESESTDGHSGVRLLVNGDLSNSLYFDLYKAGPDLVLCSTNDPDSPCEVVLRRG